MADGSRSRVQSIIVTIAAICTVIGVGYTVWTSYWRPTAELHATVEIGTYLVDPWTAASMSADREKLSAIVSELTVYHFGGGKLPASLEKYADDALKTPSYDSITLDSRRTYSYIKTVISDEGDLGAKDVALRVPNTIGSLVTFDDGSRKNFGSSPTMDLGDLKPKQKVTVYSWLPSMPMFLLSANEDIGLTYAGGKGNVEVPGKHRLFYQVFTSPLMMVWYVVFGLWFLVRAWQLGFRQGHRQGKSEL